MSTSQPDPRTTATAASVATPRHPELRVDRVACTGHGMCASLLTRVRLDEWGYPVVDDARVPAAEGEVAIRFCPARALYWSQP